MTNVVWYKILTTLDKTTTSNCIYRVGNKEHKESNELLDRGTGIKEGTSI